MVKKRVKKIARKITKGMGIANNSSKSSDVNVTNDTTVTKEAFKALVAQEQTNRESNAHFDLRASYIDVRNTALKNQILIIGSEGGSFSGIALSEFAKEVTKKKKDVIVALDKTTDYFPYKGDFTVVKKGSLEFANALGSASNIITPGELPYYFTRREKQQVVNTLDEVIVHMSAFERPLAKEHVIYQHAVLQSSTLITRKGINVGRVLQSLGIDRLFEGEIIENYDLQGNVRKLINENKRVMALRVPYAVKQFKKMQDNLKLALIMVDDSTSLDNMQALMNIIADIKENQTDVLPVFIVNPTLHRAFSKHDGVGEHTIGINRNIEPYMDKVVAVYADTDYQLESFDIDNKNRLDWDKQTILKYDSAGANPEKITQYANDRQDVLVYGGGFYNNGITSSVLNLSNYLDYTKYNFIILEKEEFKSSDASNIKKLSEHATIIQRVGTSTFNEEEQAIHRAITLEFGYREWMDKLNPFKQYAREVKRFTGKDKFDFVVDFGGYSSYYEALLLSVSAKKHSIFLHNDMWEETKRFVDGKFIMKDTLMRIFRLYKFFDAYVCVSEEVMKENQKHLSEFTDANKFATVNNLINSLDIAKKLKDDSVQKVRTANNMMYVETPDNESLSNQLISVKTAPSDNKFTFVMAGRLSPEKAHKKMMDAVSQLIKAGTTEFEVLILGEGPLKSELMAYSMSHRLQKYVKFVGQVSNPYLYFKNANAFLMSSDHEGQPMVLLEAATIGLPLVATNIPGNASVVGKVGGLLPDNNAQALAEVMKQVVNEPSVLKTPDFDVDVYNAVSYAKLEETVLKENDI